MDKDKELLLDTKGACFLCLQSIHPPATPIKSEDGENEEPPASIHSIELNLRVICRYLKIDLKYLLLQVLGRDCPADLYTCDLSVMLCGGCGRVTERLSQLARELEELQMRVNYQVQQFHEMLKGDGGRWEAVKEGMMAEGTTEEALMEVQLVELLRKEASTKGGALVKRSSQYPVVKLDRVKTDDRQEVPDEDLTGSDEEMLTNICSGHYKSLTVAQGQGFHCFPCGGRTFPDPNPRKHLFSAHPHLFFQDVKQDNLSKDHFNALCRHALQLELGKARVFLPDTKTIAECAHCHQRLRNLSATFHHHLMVKHHSRVSNSVIAIQVQQQKCQGQVEPPVRTKRRAPTPSTPFTQWLTRTCFQFYGPRENGRMECQLCQRKQEIGHAKRHVINCHPEKLFLRDKLADVNETQLRLCCDYLFQGEITRARIGNGLQCPQCPWKGVANHLFRNHLVWKHFPQLRDKMKSCQREQVWNKKPIIKKFTPVKTIPRVTGSAKQREGQPQTPPRLVPLSGGTGARGTRISQTPFTAWLIRTCYQFCGNKEKGRMECLVCHRKLVTNHATRHVVQCHAEKLFVRDKMPNVSEAQLKACSDFLFQGEIRRARKPGNVLQCPHCPWKGKFVHLFRNHLVWRHFPQLRENVKQYQSEEIWKGDSRKIISGRGRPVSSRKIISKGKISHGTTPKLAQPWNPTGAPSKTPLLVWISEIRGQFYTPATSGKGRIMCRLCTKEMDKLNGRNHLIYRHPEKALGRSRLEGVTEGEFKQFCHLLFQEEYKGVFFKEGGRPISRKCRYCEAPVSQTQHYTIHLVSYHFEDLERKLRAYQEHRVWENPDKILNNLEEGSEMKVFPEEQNLDPPSQWKSGRGPPGTPFTAWLTRTCDQYYDKTTNPGRLECLVCHRKMDASHAKKHVVQCHPEKLFLQDQLENVNESQLKLCCEHLFQQEIRNAGGNVLRCPHCPWKGQLKHVFRNHLVWRHFPELREKVKTYQRDEIWNKNSGMLSMRRQVFWKGRGSRNTTSKGKTSRAKKAEEVEGLEDFVPGEESEPLVEMQVLPDEQEEEEEIVTVKMEDILMPDFDQENVCVEEEVAEDMIFVPEVHLENSYGEKGVDDVLQERYNITEKDFIEEGGDAEMCQADGDGVSSGLWDLD